MIEIEYRYREDMNMLYAYVGSMAVARLQPQVRLDDRLFWRDPAQLRARRYEYAINTSLGAWFSEEEVAFITKSVMDRATILNVTIRLKD